MTSYGNKETNKLKSNIEEQLNRLMTQLHDLEELRGDLEEDEYESTKMETIQQLKEFEASLKKMMDGNMTLVDDLGAVRLAIQGAISQAFKTPEVIKMFANKQPRQLRFKLSELQREHKLKNISDTVYTPQAVEILAALKRLGDPLTAEETSFLQENMSKQLADFEKAAAQIAGSEILSSAAGQVRAAES